VSCALLLRTRTTERAGNDFTFPNADAAGSCALILRARTTERVGNDFRVTEADGAGSCALFRNSELTRAGYDLPFEFKG